MKKFDEFEKSIKLDENKAVFEYYKKPKDKPEGTIEIDAEGETATIFTEDGQVTIGNLYGENGTVETDKITIFADSETPLGFTTIKMSDLKKLFDAYNKAAIEEFGQFHGAQLELKIKKS